MLLNTSVKVIGYFILSHPTDESTGNGSVINDTVQSTLKALPLFPALLVSTDFSDYIDELPAVI